MHLLFLDSSLESLLAWSAAEFFEDLLPTVLLSAESQELEWLSAHSLEHINAYKCLKEIPLTCKSLEARDAHFLELIEKYLKKNATNDKFPTVDGVLSAISSVLKQVPVKPFLLVLDSTSSELNPIFGCNAVLKYFVERFSACEGASCSLHINKKEHRHLDWFLWSSQLRTRCSKNESHELKDLLSLLDNHVSDGFALGNPVCLGAVVITFSLLWHTGLIELLGCSLEMFPQVRRFISQVLANTSTSDRYRCLQRYYRFIGGSAIAEQRNTASGELESVCGNLIGQKFYVTTALSYTNGPPHIGHTYEIVTSDILVRYFRVFGMNTTLLTGTDEHGLKVATTAQNCNMYPLELADLYSAKFRENNEALLTRPDIFVRTTEPRHYKSAQKLWRILRDKGDIYLGEYCGWYNVREETFMTEVEAASTEYKDPLSGKPYTLMKEASYFFRMSNYQQRLIDKISSDPEYLKPDAARSEILSRLKKPLDDLSISRFNFTWGIPVPDDPEHVMYVWCDALSGYLSGIGFGDFDDHSQLKLWPPDVQVIGKDIIWFFAVIWTSILMSLDVPLPKTIFAHGFITAADGRKMSKSLGNTIDTKDLLVTFGADSLRYYMIRDSVFGSDVKFDLSAMADLHNADLTDTIGNLVHRITTLCVKFCNGCVPDVSDKESPRPFDMVHVASKTLGYLRDFALQDALVSAIDAFRDTNKYLTDREPWAKGSETTRHDTIRNVLEAVYFLNHLMQPVIPTAAAVVFKKLNTEPKRHIGLLSANYDNLKVGTKVVVGEILFQKVGETSRTK
ncbi:methionyl-tRNA synthetase [Babesia caballi]|uniref:methionine--tRNA ligase n=1 Tax=Babesia caballi TaxID=5871 RepID=A0AAV4LW75_BABCB|nr:methionyl-tRNA synthetase [Babesia caballi]